MKSPIPKASPEDYLSRFREIVSDPCNCKIRRVPLAGFTGCECENGERFVVMHNGILVPHRQYYGRFADILIINRGVHEPQEELVFGMAMPEIPDGEPMIELGAYWGFYSAWFKRSHPNSKVLLVEPNPEHLAVGRATFRLNKLEGVFYQGVVGGPNGLNLRTFTELHKINKLGILHVDIQGSEETLLREERSLLAERKIRFLFISTHSQEIHERCRDLIMSEGYRIIADADYNSVSFSCDGLIVACEPGTLFNSVPLWSRASGETLDSASAQ